MKFKKWQIFAGLVTLTSILTTFFPETSTSETLRQNVSTSIPVGNEVISTVPGSNCREVNTSELQVLKEPGGQVIRQLTEGQQVYIANEGRNGWVPIESPTDGYVTSANLRMCGGMSQSVNESDTTATVPVSDCREVKTAETLVRDRPRGEVIGRLDEDQTVYIRKKSQDGWVPVEYSVDGYVTSTNLTYCNAITPGFAPESCREVEASNPLKMREKPNGEIIASLEDEQRIAILNRGQNGWVPAFAKIEGYIPAESLKSCY